MHALLRANLSQDDDSRTLGLIQRLRAASRRGHLTKSELEAVCRWKSARAIHLVQSNNHHRIRAATSAAFATRNESSRIEALASLRGVSIPMASAILMLLWPNRYGVLDIRVWQLLHEERVVSDNPGGTKFTTLQWRAFLDILRTFAAELGVSARAIERTLFAVDQARRTGRLYGSYSNGGGRVMAENKTRATKASVKGYLAAIKDPSRRKDCVALTTLMTKATKHPPVMWGTSIVGFGSYHYKYESGREGEACLVGFSSRKSDITFYLLADFPKQAELLARLGKHKMSGSCLHVGKLSDVDPKTLTQLVVAAMAERKRRHPQ